MRRAAVTLQLVTLLAVTSVLAAASGGILALGILTLHSR
jgi:hypothetical protein